MSQDPELRAPNAFPTTRWSSLALGAQGPDGDPDRRRAAFESLARRYWRPIAAAVRARSARSDEDAIELTQEFFLWMLEQGFLARADPARGSFRGFIKRSLFNFLTDVQRRDAAQRRGGGRKLFSLDADDALELPRSEARSPEQLLDDVWRRELLSQAAQALRAELAARGKARTFEIFQRYFLESEDTDYGRLAAELGISTTDVSNALAYAKKRYRAQLRSAVLDTVAGDEELRGELAWLFEEQGP